jgi:hypothetical protein
LGNIGGKINKTWEVVHLMKRIGEYSWNEVLQEKIWGEP